LRGNIGSIVSKLVSTVGAEKKVSQDSSFQKGDLAKEQPINEGATGDGWDSHGSQVEKSLWISIGYRGTQAYGNQAGQGDKGDLHSHFV
jgi:hypothetical protein